MSRQLPRGWDERVDEKSGRTYYVNHETRQTSWTLPSEQPLPPGWEQQYDGKGRVFFINHEKEITTWTDPRNNAQEQQPPQQQHQQPQAQQPTYNSARQSLTKILKPGTLIKVHKSAVEAISAMVLGYDDQRGTHSIALENGRTDDINLAAVSHENIDDLMERIARFFVICEQAHRTFPPNSNAIELSLNSITTTIKDWMGIYTSPDVGSGVDKQSQLGQVLSYFMDQRAALVLTQAMELGGALGEAAIQCLAEINNILRLADPTSVARVSRALQEAGVTRGLVYLLRGGSAELCVKILHVVSFFSGDVEMVRNFEAAGGVALLCELLVNAPIQQHAVTVLQQMLAVDERLVNVIRDTGGVQYLYLVLESSSGHVQKQALLVLQKVFAGSSSSDISGILQPLIRILSAGGDAAPQAVEMLVPLAKSSQTAAALVDAGSIGSMIQLCQSGQASDALKVEVFDLLHSIASTNSTCVQQLAQSVAPQMLLSVVSDSVSRGGVSHALTTSALALLADLCDNEKVCGSVRSNRGVEILIATLQSAVPSACKGSAVTILASLCEADPSVADEVATSGAAEAAIALLTGASDKAKNFIASLLNRPDVLQGTMATLRSNEPLLTMMVKSFVNQLKKDPNNHDPVYSLQTFCTLPDDGHVMLQVRRLQIANAAGAVPALIKLIRDAGPLPMKMAAMSTIADLAKDPTTCSVLEESNAFAVICTGLTSWELPQLQEVALSILQYMFSGGLTLKTLKEAQMLAEALASCVAKDHAQVQALALRLCEPLCTIEQYRVAIGHVIAPNLAALFDGSAGRILAPELRDTALQTLATLSADRKTIDALVEAGAVKFVAKILTSSMEEGVLALVLDILVQVVKSGAKGCDAFLQSHENDLMKFVELLPPTPLQPEEVTSRALSLLMVLCQQPAGSIKQIMAIDGFLDKMLSSCQNEDYPEYRAAMLSIAQSAPDEAALVWDGVERRVDVSAALVLLDSTKLAVRTKAIESLAASCRTRPEHAVARIVESGKIQAITSQLQSTNQALQEATLTVIGACSGDSAEVRDVLVQNVQILVRLLLSYSTPVVASAISVLRDLARSADDFWPEVLRTTNRKLVIDCLAGLFARQSLDPAHRVEVSQLLAELLGRIDVLSDAESNVVSHTLHSTLTILKETNSGSTGSIQAQLSTLNQLLQKVPSCKSQLLRYPWLLPRLVLATAAESADDRAVGTQLLQAYADSEAVKDDSIQLLVQEDGLSVLHKLLETLSSIAQSGTSTSEVDNQAEPALALPVRLVAEIALGPQAVRLKLFESPVWTWVVGHVAQSFGALGVEVQSNGAALDIDTHRSTFAASIETIGGLAAVGSLRPHLAENKTFKDLMRAVLSVDPLNSEIDPDFRKLYLDNLPALLQTVRFVSSHFEKAERDAIAQQVIQQTLPPLHKALLAAPKDDNGAQKRLLGRLNAGVSTALSLAVVGCGPSVSAALLDNSAKMLVALLQVIATQPTADVSQRALSLFQTAAFVDDSFSTEFLARGGVDRLGSALAKAKRHGPAGESTTENVLTTLVRLSIQPAVVNYFNGGKSPAVYSIVRSLAQAKVEPGTVKADHAVLAQRVLSHLGLHVRSRSENRQAQQKKQSRKTAVISGSAVVRSTPAPSLGGSATATTRRAQPPPPSYGTSPTLRPPSGAPPAVSSVASTGLAPPPSYAPPPARGSFSSPMRAPVEPRSAEIRISAPRTSFLTPNQPLAAPAPRDSKPPPSFSSSPNKNSQAETVQVPALNIGNSPKASSSDVPPPAVAPKAVGKPTAPTSAPPSLPQPYQAPSGSTAASASAAPLGPPKYEPPPSFSYAPNPAPASMGQGLPAPVGNSLSNSSYQQEAPRFYQEPDSRPQNDYDSSSTDPSSSYLQYDAPAAADQYATSNYTASAPGATDGGSSNNVEPGDSADMQSLLALGFDRDQCAIALAQTDGKVDQAAALLFGEELAPEATGGAPASAAAVAEEEAPMEIPTFDDGVRMNGELMKRSQHLKQWRKRFFVLKGDTLYSFKNRDDSMTDLSEASARADIRNVYKIAPGTTVGEAAEKEHGFQVKLVPTPEAEAKTDGAGKKIANETELFLSATDSSLRKRWMDAIRKVVTDLDAVANTKDAAEMQRNVQQLRGMGYARDACVAALTESNNDVNAALDLLLLQGASTDNNNSSSNGSTSAANRASSSAVETKDDELYPQMDQRIATIKLPSNARPGQPTEVTAPDGSRYRIVVPSDKRAGDEIKMRY